MTVADHEDLGTWDYFRTLIHDLDLVDEFEDTWNESLEDFELEVSESEVIRETLETAPDTYILVTSERPPAYRVLRLVE